MDIDTYLNKKQAKTLHSDRFFTFHTNSYVFIASYYFCNYPILKLDRHTLEPIEALCGHPTYECINQYDYVLANRQKMESGGKYHYTAEYSATELIPMMLALQANEKEKFSIQDDEEEFYCAQGGKSRISRLFNKHGVQDDS